MGLIFASSRVHAASLVQSRAGLGDPPDVRGSQPGQGWFRPLSLSEVASSTAAVLGASSPWAGVYTGLTV